MFPSDQKAGLRSFVSVWNVCDLIKTLVCHNPDQSHIYLVSDGQDCTTYGILRFIALSQGTVLIPLPIPAWIIRAVLFAVKHEKIFNQVFGAMQLDITDTTERLDWRPIHDTRGGIQKLISEERLRS